MYVAVRAITGVAEKIARVYHQERPPANVDPDAALYDGFLQEEDRSRCHFFHQERKAGRWLSVDFKDERLARLCGRLKARSFASELSVTEVAEWREFVGHKLGGPLDEATAWANLARFRHEIAQMREEMRKEATLDASASGILDQLQSHADRLAEQYGL